VKSCGQSLGQRLDSLDRSLGACGHSRGQRYAPVSPMYARAAATFLDRATLTQHMHACPAVTRGRARNIAQEQSLAAHSPSCTQGEQPPVCATGASPASSSAQSPEIADNVSLLGADEVPHGSDTQPSMLEELYDHDHDGEVFNEELDYQPIFDPPPFDAQKAPGGEKDKDEPLSRKFKKDAKKKFATSEYDERTNELVINPGSEVDWSLDTGLADHIPTAFAHKMKDRPSQRLLARSGASTTSTARGTKVQFLFDSGTEVTQIPVAYRDLLDDIQELPQPLQLIIAGLERPLCKEIGVLRYKVQGVDEIYEIDCLLNPTSDIFMVSADDIEGQWIDKAGEIDAKLHSDRVDFYRYGVSVPIIRHGRSPFIEMEIVSGNGTTRHSR